MPTIPLFGNIEILEKDIHERIYIEDAFAFLIGLSSVGIYYSKPE